MKQCSNCLYNDDCAADGACEYYTPCGEPAESEFEFEELIDNLYGFMEEFNEYIEELDE